VFNQKKTGAADPGLARPVVPPGPGQYYRWPRAGTTYTGQAGVERSSSSQLPPTRTHHPTLPPVPVATAGRRPSGHPPARLAPWGSSPSPPPPWPPVWAPFPAYFGRILSLYVYGSRCYVLRFLAKSCNGVSITC
jgi:hypothetical protein